MNRAPPKSQVQASSPAASVFVKANAGSGKTSTLVTRVARLLLAGADPAAILCVTFTKAGAAEMQKRLFDDLGVWAVASDADLARDLADIDEAGRDLAKARALFARALETPGGLKIQTIHAFCERLLRRFPLEAGLAPGFTVLEDQAAAEVSALARQEVASLALARPGGEVAQAYDHFAVELDYRGFGNMFAAFEARRRAIEAHVAACEARGTNYRADAWRRCGFATPTPPAGIVEAALQRTRTVRWRSVAETLAGMRGVTESKLGAAMLALPASTDFAALRTVFLTLSGTPRQRLVTPAVSASLRDWLAGEQAHVAEADERLAAAQVADDTVRALTLAVAYAGAYEGAKAARGGLDYGDLISRTLELITRRADAAWVLYKLDGGLEHVLLDEAQDTAPEQWAILRALTGEFFHGEGARAAGRTVFAVGDEKQSIFSFQGADPRRLALETQDFEMMVRGAGQRFTQVALRESWRSAPEILSFVDKMFEAPDALAGVRPSGGNVAPTRLRHDALRKEHGCVELWPMEAAQTTEADIDPWAPVDAEPGKSANKLLAERVARAVADMVARGEAVTDRRSGAARACRFGDVMILVRRRGALFHEIIRALKRVGAQVAGADRLRLSEHGVFEDLMGLGRFVAFPDDDLALAALLRGPLAEVSDEALFDLAHDRQASLWRTLRRRASERPAWAEAAALLSWAREEAARAPPFDFYCRLLGRLDAAGRSMRQRILTRLSAEGEQALDAFVSQALAAEAAGARDMESFLAWMGGSELEIKRELAEGEHTGAGEVRVMTAHGAKGLEAPVVILPDTTTKASAQGGPLLETADGAFLWAPRKADDAAASADARAVRDRAVDHESFRLLYVAMTRARDRLIVAGVERQSQWFNGSWYDYVVRAFAELDTRPFALPQGGEGARFGPDPVRLAAGPAPAQAPLVLPAWTLGLAPREAASRYASPSHLGDIDAGPAPSPLASIGGLGRYRRGDLIHRLLQWLPDLAAEARPAAALRLLAREADLTEVQREEMAAAALTVLDDARFAAVFGPGSRAEVPIAGRAGDLPADLVVSGRIDRLLLEPDRVLVVDYKTNRPAPARIEDADPQYVRQMAVYRAVLAEVYPGRRVEAALVWTDGPALMPVPPALMDAALKDVLPASP